MTTALSPVLFIACLCVATGLLTGVRRVHLQQQGAMEALRPTPRVGALFASTKPPPSEEPPLVIDGSAEYYKGLITSNDPKDAERDNVTPNLKFGAIFVVLLSGLFYAFVEANKNIPPPPF